MAAGSTSESYVLIRVGPGMDGCDGLDGAMRIIDGYDWWAFVVGPVLAWRGMSWGFLHVFLITACLHSLC